MEEPRVRPRRQPAEVLRRGRSRKPPLRDVGHEPDHRFSLANERTFLAWIRTALALVAAGLGIIQLLPPFAVSGGREVLGAVLVLIGATVAATSHRRWERNERALRMDAPLPPGPLPPVLAAGVAVAAVLALVLALSGGEA